MLTGCTWVSTDEQSTRLQLDALASAGWERIFSEQTLGARYPR